ncbi:MAG: hypothetical protein WD690_00795 [Vicinamibacterales bacterium]
MRSRLTPLCLLVAFAAACGGATPTSPSPSGFPPVPQASQFEGVWQIEYRIAECNGLRHCFAFNGTTRTIGLRLVAEGGGYDGVVSVSNENIDVTGTIGVDGALVLTGIRRPAIAADLEVEIKQLQLRLLESGAAGNFDYTVKGLVSSFFVNSRLAGPIVSAERVGSISTVNAKTFTGTWKGRIAVRDCSSVGWRDCYPLEPHELWNVELVLTQTGNRISGLLKAPGGVTIEGSATGSTAQLAGAATSAAPSHTTFTTLRTATLTRDLVGRLKGTLSLEMRWHWNDPPRVSSSDFRVIELIDVIRSGPS